jgi:hypothetical protein
MFLKVKALCKMLTQPSCIDFQLPVGICFLSLLASLLKLNLHALSCNFPLMNILTFDFSFNSVTYLFSIYRLKHELLSIHDHPRHFSPCLSGSQIPRSSARFNNLYHMLRVSLNWMQGSYAP